MKCVIISGYLIHSSDNIIPFLDKDTDLYIHTWSDRDNQRWVYKFNRFKKYCKSIKIVVEDPISEDKLYSYLYSTYKVVNSIKDIEQYKTIIKFKPNTIGEIKYKGDTDYYFRKGYLQSKPLLEGITKQECFFGCIYYQTMDERIFTGFPESFKRCFKKPIEVFNKEFNQLNNNLLKKYNGWYEGSIFWKEWCNQNKVIQIQDLDLTIPNNKNYE